MVTNAIKKKKPKQDGMIGSEGAAVIRWEMPTLNPLM